MFLLSSHLKELYSDTCEHELEQRGDDDDVADGPDGHEDALHYVLENNPPENESECNAVAPFVTRALRVHRRVRALTFSPLALLMALRGLSTRRTLRIFTTLIALDLEHTQILTSGHSNARFTGKDIFETTRTR